METNEVLFPGTHLTKRLDDYSLDDGDGTTGDAIEWVVSLF